MAYHNVLDGAWDEKSVGVEEHELATLLGFVSTTLLHLASRQEILARALIKHDAAVGVELESLEGGPAVIDGALFLLAILERCIDSSTPPDSLLWQIKAQLESCDQMQ